MIKTLLWSPSVKGNSVWLWGNISSLALCGHRAPSNQRYVVVNIEAISDVSCIELSMHVETWPDGGLLEQKGEHPFTKVPLCDVWPSHAERCYIAQHAATNQTHFSHSPPEGSGLAAPHY